MDVVSFSVTQFQYFILVLFRVAGLMLVAPFFGSVGIPRKIKFGLALVIALAIFPAVPRTGLALPGALSGYIIASVGEIMIGVVLGFAASLAFAAVQLAGHYVGQEMGLTLANVVDPTSMQQIGIVSQFKYIFATLIFFAVGGHLLLLWLLFWTFEMIPLMSLSYSRLIPEYIARGMAAEMFVESVRLAAPAIIAMLITTVAMGFIAKTAPEVNIFILSFGIRAGIGLLILLISVPYVARVVEVIFNKMFYDMQELVTIMAG